MSVHDFGRRLLGEAEEANLQEILLAFNAFAAATNSSSTAPEQTPQPYLNIPSIDRILSSHVSGSRAFDAAQYALSSHKVYYPSIEITSGAPGAGKTQFLYYVIAAAILPPEHGGKGAAVVIMDTDGGLDVIRLAAVLRQFIEKNRTTQEVQNERDQDMETTSVQAADDNRSDEQDLQTTIHRTLQHVHIFRPTSLTSLVATIEHLPNYLLDSTAHHSAAKEVSLILVDSVTAFFWQQRMATETSRLVADNSEDSAILDCGISDSPAPASYQSLVAVLHSAQVLFGATVVTTAWGLLPIHRTHATTSGDNTPTSFRPLLPHPWPSFSTVRFTITCDAVNRFPVNMNLEAALRDREVRQEVVDQGRRSLWLSSDEGVRRICGFRITGGGVSVNE